jgi:FtsP/CotA-like multicopper oxidase with cupredoxin domain
VKKSVAILPQRIKAGITLDRPVVLTAYPANVWAITVHMRGPGSINVVSVPDGNAHRLRANAEATGTWQPGVYWYSARVSNEDGDVFEIESGEVVIDPNLAEATAGYDGSTHAQRVLSAIEAVLEKRATQDQERYKINNRELWRTPIPELLTLRDRYRAQVKMEARAKRGDLFGTAVRVRFR